MKKVTRKEIIHAVEEAMGSALEKLNIATPSKKTKKLLGKVSKKFSGQLKAEVKKLDKKAAKATKKIKSGIASKKVKTQAKKIE